MSKMTKEDAKRKKITDSYNKKISKCQNEMTARLSRIKTSEEYKKLFEGRFEDDKAKLEALYKFSKRIEKYYEPKPIRYILQKDENDLKRFNDFYGSLVEIIKMYDALKKINFEGKNSVEIMAKIVDVDLKEFTKCSVDYAVIRGQVEEKQFRRELQEFLDGKKEIKTGSEVVKEIAVDTGRYMGKEIGKLVVTAGKEGIKIILHNHKRGI